MSTTTTGPSTDLRFEVHICAQRRSYWVTFTGPDAAAHAIAFLAPKGSTHAYFLTEGDDAAITADLEAFLWPTCEHGLSERLCAGPGHYPMD